jgi:hypothetical protein
MVLARIVREDSSRSGTNRSISGKAEFDKIAGSDVWVYHAAKILLILISIDHKRKDWPIYGIFIDTKTPFLPIGLHHNIPFFLTNDIFVNPNFLPSLKDVHLSTERSNDAKALKHAGYVLHPDDANSPEAEGMFTAKHLQNAILYIRSRPMSDPIFHGVYRYNAEKYAVMKHAFDSGTDYRLAHYAGPADTGNLKFDPNMTIPIGGTIPMHGSSSSDPYAKFNNKTRNQHTRFISSLVGERAKSPEQEFPEIIESDDELTTIPLPDSDDEEMIEIEGNTDAELAKRIQEIEI